MELTRLFEAQKRRERELEILRKASLGFAAATDRATLTTLILAYALRLVSALNAFLFFYDNEKLEFGGMLWAQDSPVSPQAFAPRDDGLTHTVARTGEMLVIDNVNTHPLFASWRWGGAIIGLPLKAGGEVRAILNVAYAQPHTFAAEELYVLQLFADQAAAALESARHYAETARQLRDAQLLHRAGEALNRTLTFAEAVDQLADLFIEALEVEVCCISTVDVAADTIQVVVDRDPREDSRLAPGTIGKLSSQVHFTPLLHEQRTLTFRGDSSTLDPQLRASMERYHWRSLLVLSLFAGNELIGIIELADQQSYRDFSAESVRLAESLAHQAASALHKARLFQELERRVRELQRASAV
jgi:GAF domain-containing protein